MRKELADIVCCPVHKGPLVLTARRTDAGGDILEGTLHCAACPFDYPIEDGIPNLLPPSYHVDEVPERRDPDGDGRKPAGAPRRTQDSEAQGRPPSGTTARRAPRPASRKKAAP